MLSVRQSGEPREPKVTTGYLKRIAALVTSGTEEAILALGASRTRSIYLDRKFRSNKAFTYYRKGIPYKKKGIASNELTGSQVIIECLKEQGVDTVFGYPGGAILNVMTSSTSIRRLSMC